MNINSLSGPRMTPLTSANSASSTARTSFGSLLQGANAAKAGGAGQLTGGNVIAAAINVNSNPGASTGVGAPYQQATTPAQAAAGGAQAGADTQKIDMMRQLAVLSISSFASSTFSLGNNRIQLEAAD